MTKWIAVNTSPMTENCIEVFEYDGTSITEKAKEIIGCRNTELARCWFTLDEGQLEHPLYLICNEDFLREKEKFNPFATLLYIGPYEIAKPELRRYIAGKAVLCTIIEGEVMELTPKDIEAIRQLRIRAKESIEKGGTL